MGRCVDRNVKEPRQEAEILLVFDTQLSILFFHLVLQLQEILLLDDGSLDQIVLDLIQGLSQLIELLVGLLGHLDSLHVEGRLLEIVKVPQVEVILVLAETHRQIPRSNLKLPQQVTDFPVRINH